MKLGIIADTHGVLHPRVLEVFRGVDRILHAGDIGGDSIIRELETIAPVTAIPGNNDQPEPVHERLEFCETRFLLTHILGRPRRLAPEVRHALSMERADVVIFGHSHLPHDEIVDGVHFFNPASAGPRRFDYPTSVGFFEWTADTWRSWHVPLDERSVDALAQRMNQLSR